MRLGRGGGVAVLTLAIGALGVGLAVAQDGARDEQSSPDATGLEGTARRRSHLSAADQQREAQRIQERGSTLSRRVTGMLDEARREGDVIRVTCLDDKLTQINAHLRTLGDRIEALTEAIQVGDEGRRNHEFTVISVLGQNISELERAANECIGQDLFETGTTRVTTTIDPNVPDEDPSDMPVPQEPATPFIPPPPSCDPMTMAC